MYLISLRDVMFLIHNALYGAQNCRHIVPMYSYMYVNEVLLCIYLYQIAPGCRLQQLYTVSLKFFFYLTCKVVDKLLKTVGCVHL